MTVQEFLQNYGGNECVSIEGYCEEKQTSGSCLMITQITTNRPV